MDKPMDILMDKPMDGLGILMNILMDKPINILIDKPMDDPGDYIMDGPSG